MFLGVIMNNYDDSRLKDRDMTRTHDVKNVKVRGIPLENMNLVANFYVIVTVVRASEQLGNQLRPNYLPMEVKS